MQAQLVFGKHTTQMVRAEASGHTWEQPACQLTVDIRWPVERANIGQFRWNVLNGDMLRMRLMKLIKLSRGLKEKFMLKACQWLMLIEVGFLPFLRSLCSTVLAKKMIPIQGSQLGRHSRQWCKILIPTDLLLRCFKRIRYSQAWPVFCLHVPGHLAQVQN